MKPGMLGESRPGSGQTGRDNCPLTDNRLSDNSTGPGIGHQAFYVSGVAGHDNLAGGLGDGRDQRIVIGSQCRGQQHRHGDIFTRQSRGEDRTDFGFDTVMINVSWPPRCPPNRRSIRHAASRHIDSRIRDHVTPESMSKINSELGNSARTRPRCRQCLVSLGIQSLLGRCGKICCAAPLCGSCAQDSDEERCAGRRVGSLYVH